MRRATHNPLHSGVRVVMMRPTGVIAGQDLIAPMRMLRIQMRSVRFLYRCLRCGLVEMVRVDFLLSENRRQAKSQDECEQLQSFH